MKKYLQRFWNIFKDEIDESCDTFRISVPSGIHSFNKENLTQMDIQTFDQILFSSHDGTFSTISHAFRQSRMQKKTFLKTFTDPWISLQDHFQETKPRVLVQSRSDSHVGKRADCDDGTRGGIVCQV